MHRYDMRARVCVCECVTLLWQLKTNCENACMYACMCVCASCGASARVRAQEHAASARRPLSSPSPPQCLRAQERDKHTVASGSLSLSALSHCLPLRSRAVFVCCFVCVRSGCALLLSSLGTGCGRCCLATRCCRTLRAYLAASVWLEQENESVKSGTSAQLSLSL